MSSNDNIFDTVKMLQEDNLDVRTLIMGINLNDCSDRNANYMTECVIKKIKAKAGNLVRICEQITEKYGINIINKRVAISPASVLLEGHSDNDALLVAKALDYAASETDVDLIGGFTALVHNGITQGEKVLIDSLPRVLSSTKRLCSSISIGSSKAGINVDAVKIIGETILKIANSTKAQNGFGCAKLVVFANIPDNNPFMAGAFVGPGEADCVINVGVSGPGVIKRTLKRFIEKYPDCTFGNIAEEIKHSTFRVVRTGELIGKEIATTLGVKFGAVDLSLAPSPTVGDSVGEIYQAMGISRIGSPGTTAAVGLLNDAVKKGGIFASPSVGGLSGAFLPVMEDSALSDAVRKKYLSIEKLEAMTSVCSVGLDMICIPGDTDASVICGIIMDEAAIGIYNHKTTAVRIIPVPGKNVGDFVDFGGLFGSSHIINFQCPSECSEFINHGGIIPAPLTSFRN